MAHLNGTQGNTKQIRLVKRSPAYWRVTFDHPPLNIFGPQTIPQLNEIVTALETDQLVKVVVFDSAVEGFFLTHYDFLAKPVDFPPGPTGLQQLPDMLVRISRAPVVSIAMIRGRATGVGSELALASDMRFASREKALLSQWEVGAALVPGGGPYGAPAASGGQRTCSRNPSGRGRYSRRPGRALRIRESFASRCRARWICRRARNPHGRLR